MRVFSEPHLFEGPPRHAGTSVPQSRSTLDADPVADAVVKALGETSEPPRRRGSFVEVASLVVSDVVGLAISAAAGVGLAVAADTLPADRASGVAYGLMAA